MEFYDAISGDDLRLIGVRPRSLQDPLECELQVFTSERRPTYIALSYVWGHPKDTMDIQLNGQTFSVTRNLYHALCQIRMWSMNNELKEVFGDGQESWFWIDAICINQVDDDEKAKQVSRMGEIYSNALLVLCWLGQNEALEDDVVKMIFDKSDDIIRDDRASDLEWLYSYPLANDLGVQYEAFKSAFLNIIRRPWFSRIWTIQEAVLAGRDPIFALGNHTSSALLTLWLILSKVETNPLHDLVLRSNLGLYKIHVLRKMSKELLEHHNNGHDLSSFAKRMNTIMKYTTLGYKCTLPQDMLYGVLGLAHAPKLPGNLAPNYKLPFAEVYQAYARFLIEETGDLTILAQNENNLGSVPSWVPDFRIHRTRAKESAVSASAYFSADGEKLHIQGFRCGTPVGIHKVSADINGVQLKDLLRSYEQLILKSSTLRGIVFKDVLSDWLESFTTDSINISTLKALYGVFAEGTRFGVEDIDPAQRNTIMTTNLANDVAATLHTHLTVYTHIVLNNGAIAQVHRDCVEVCVDDVLCIFKGSDDAFLLRPCPEGYRLMSSCEIRTGLVTDFGEEFFASRRLETFCIV